MANSNPISTHLFLVIASLTTTSTLLLSCIYLKFNLGIRLLPPPHPKSRTSKIPEGSYSIDNAIYDEDDYANDWQDEGRNPLFKLNKARVPYFVKVWREEVVERKEAEEKPEANLRFLDVGCGGGVATEALAKEGFDIVGIDLSSKSIDVAKAHAASEGIANVQYLVGSAYSLPFPDSSFDGVVSSDVLEHLYDLPQMIAEVSRVLKPNGVFVFDTINRTYTSYYLSYLLAQRLLGFIPPDSHSWELFIRPSELSSLLVSHSLQPSLDENQRGMQPTINLNPLKMYSEWKRGNGKVGVLLGDFKLVGRGIGGLGLAGSWCWWARKV